MHRHLSFKSNSTDSSESDCGTDIVANLTEATAIHRVPLSRLLKMNGDDWPYVLVGGLAAIVMGASLPIFAVIFGKFFEVKIILQYVSFNE